MAEVRQVLKTDDETIRILVEGKYRAKLVNVISETPYFVAEVQEYPLKTLRPKKSILCDALMRTIKD